MKQSEGQNGQLPEDARRELGRCGAGNSVFDKELHAYKRLCNEDERMDESYKILLVSLFMKEKQFIVPQKMKRAGKLNEPLLPMLRFKNNKDRLIIEDYDDVREDFETTEKRKGKGLLICYVGIDVHDVVGNGNKILNGKQHLIEPEHDSEKTTFEPHTEKRSAHPLNDKEHPTRRSWKVIYNGYSSDDDEDMREEIEKHSSLGIRNIVTKKPRNENAEVDFVKCSCRSRKVYYKDYSSDEDEGVGIEKRHVCRSRKTTLEELIRNKDERQEIEKHSSPEFRNVTKKKPYNEKTEADVEKHWSRRSRKVIYYECSSDEDEDGNVDIRIKKRPTYRLRKVVMNKSSDDENTEMLPLKRAAHEYRKVATKRQSVEDIEEEVKKFRNFLLKKSRYETEGGAPRGHTKFCVGEPSVRRKNIDEDSSEGKEESSESDSDVEILDIDECPNWPFVPSKRRRILEVGGGPYRLSEEYIEFRRQVLEVISKPFDKSEYKLLQTEFHARCYPGYHQDLVKILKKSTWNPRKRLAMLRGFFFWLQNLTRQGSFKPWHDNVCLQVEPERTRQIN